MKILELISFIESRVDGVYFPNRFPTEAVDECISVKLTGGFPTSQWTGKRQPSFQILVRGRKGGEEDCENKAYELFNSLTNLKEVMIGEDSVVIIRASTSDPIPIGYDENDRPQYSLNFNCVVRP